MGFLTNIELRGKGGLKDPCHYKSFLAAKNACKRYLVGICFMRLKGSLDIFRKSLQVSILLELKSVK